MLTLTCLSRHAYSDMRTLTCLLRHVSSPEICAADSSLGTGSPMGQDSLFMSKVCLPEESGRSMLGPALRMLAGTRSPRMPTIVWKGARRCTEGVFQDSEKSPLSYGVDSGIVSPHSTRRGNRDASKLSPSLRMTVARGTMSDSHIYLFLFLENEFPLFAL